MTTEFNLCERILFVIGLILIIVFAIGGFIFLNSIDNQVNKDRDVYRSFCNENNGTQSNNMAMRYCIINKEVYRMDYSGDKLILFKEN